MKIKQSSPIGQFELLLCTGILCNSEIPGFSIGAAGDVTLDEGVRRGETQTTGLCPESASGLYLRPDEVKKRPPSVRSFARRPI